MNINLVDAKSISKPYEMHIINTSTIRSYVKIKKGTYELRFIGGGENGGDWIESYQIFGNLDYLMATTIPDSSGRYEFVSIFCDLNGDNEVEAIFTHQPIIGWKQVGFSTYPVVVGLNDADSDLNDELVRGHLYDVKKQLYGGKNCDLQSTQSRSELEQQYIKKFTASRDYEARMVNRFNTK